MLIRCFCALITLWPALVLSSNTGGVFGPVVTPGHRAAQYRIAQDPDSHAVAQRVHYEASVDDRFMWRAIAQLRKTPESDLDFDFFQGEFFVELSDVADDWKQGLRLDVRLRDEDRPHQLGLNWMHQVPLGSEWRARLLLLSALQFGNGSADGLFLQSRASIGRSLSARARVDAEWFSSYGSSQEFASWEQQVHQLGPTMSVTLGRGWSVFGGPLFGMTRRSPDLHLRAWVTRRF